MEGQQVMTLYNYAFVVTVKSVHKCEVEHKRCEHGMYCHTIHWTAIDFYNSPVHMATHLGCWSYEAIIPGFIKFEISEKMLDPTNRTIVENPKGIRMTCAYAQVGVLVNPNLSLGYHSAVDTVIACGCKDFGGEYSIQTLWEMINKVIIHANGHCTIGMKEYQPIIEDRWIKI